MAPPSLATAAQPAGEQGRVSLCVVSGSNFHGIFPVVLILCGPRGEGGLANIQFTPRHRRSGLYRGVIGDLRP